MRDNDQKSAAAPNGLFRVPEDGTLATAIATVADCGVIRVAAGIHTVTESLRITRSLKIQGAGAGLTRIQAAKNVPLVSASGQGSVVISGLTLAARTVLTSLVQLDVAQFCVRDCQFLGPFSMSQEKPRRRWPLNLAYAHCAALEISSGHGTVSGSTFRGHACGIAIHGPGSHAELRDNECVENGRDGVRVASGATADAAGNLCADNLGRGIFFFGQACGSATDNLCAANGQSGISVALESSARLSGNHCQGNSRSGICVMGHSTAEIHENVCMDNMASLEGGITVEDHSEAKVTGNHCAGNAGPNINVTQYSKAEVRDNLCEKNGQDAGISIDSGSEGLVTGNRCFKNRLGGIWILDAKGWIQDNICEGSALLEVGILVLSSEAEILNNRCTNFMAGIKVGDSPGCMLRNNICEKNAHEGINVTNAKADLIGNRCTGNRQSGIYFSSNSTGKLHCNVCTGNGWRGIFLNTSGDVHLHANQE